MFSTIQHFTLTQNKKKYHILYKLTGNKLKYIHDQTFYKELKNSGQVRVLLVRVP